MNSIMARVIALIIAAVSLTATSAIPFLAVMANDELVDPAGPGDLLVELSGSADLLLENIGNLEAERDAKCNSTASRFEDFLFGTPLADQARIENVEFQKKLIRRLWFAASSRAREDAREAVGAEEIREEVDEILTIHPQSDNKLSIHFSGQPPIEISRRRLQQYASIAFSLRSILGVEQEFLLSNGPTPLPLEQEAIEALRDSIDYISVSVLMRADESSRKRNEFEIEAGLIRTTWSELIPASQSMASAGDLSSSLGENPVESALLMQLIDQKTAAYRAYNDLGERKARALFITNTVRFYARAKIGRNRTDRSKIIVAVNKSLADFSRIILGVANDMAGKKGHALIRADDAIEATHRLLPQEIDEFEDVHVFPNLPREERVVLEAYDCDSFRDFGVHWLALKHALEDPTPGSRSLDPFAAEIIAETISQYGVLLLRMAGDEVKRQADDMLLRPEDLMTSAAQISERLENYPQHPPTPNRAELIASARPAPQSEGPDLFFTDITQDVGFEFIHRSSKWLGEFRHKEVNTPPTFSGGGVAAEDIDGDGHLDLLLLGGAGNALLMGEGNGQFVDLAAEAGIDYRREDGSAGEPRKPIVADFDNDGRQDILITYVDDDHRIYRNLGERRFLDVTSVAGLGGRGLIGGPATVFDFDDDGLLDIYIGYFGNYLESAIPTQERDNHDALPNRLFRNLGEMRFEDVTEKSGTGDRGWTQAVSHLDFDRDGKQDIFVANDYGLNAFFRNLGDGRFEDVAAALGMRKALHSMNVGITDINADGYPDIYVSNIATLIKDNKYIFPDITTPLDFDLRAMSGMLVKEADTFFVSEAKAEALSGYQLSTDIERGESSTGWAWDAEFLDFDLDGDDDLYLVNGINDYNAFSMIFNQRQDREEGPAVLLSHSRESNVFFLNEGGKLKNRSADSGADFVGNSRSTAYFDFDSDGDLDIVVNNFHSGATLLRNNAQERGWHWLKIRLLGDPKKNSNRDAIGARITIQTEDGIPRTRIVQGGSGYLSMNPKEQHFGLGDSLHADIKVSWPNGEEESFLNVAANGAYTISQGSPISPTKRPRPKPEAHPGATPGASD